MKPRNGVVSMKRNAMLIGAVLLTLAGSNLGVLKAGETVMPTTMDQDRFFAVPVIEGGEAMRWLTDTGGGVFLFDDAALRLKLSVSGVNLAEYKGMAAQFPKFEEGKAIPTPRTEGDVIPIAPGPVRMRLSWLTKDIDGIMGQGWFGDRVWTLDYPGRKLLYHETDKPTPSEKMRKLPLGFRLNEKGDRSSNYPRIEVSIGGKTLDVLLASGATVALTAEALKAIDEGGPAIRATSLVSTTIFEEWQKEHPQWRVVQNAEEGSGEPLIEVPEVTIAGFAVGPVWFTRRPDDNFSEHFSNWTDKPVHGAIGGNVLKHFRILLDYPRAAAWLEKP